MAQLSSAKSIIILSVIFGCFAILWPKIFLPLFRDAFSTSTIKDMMNYVHPRLRNFHKDRTPELKIRRSEEENLRPFPGMSAQMADRQSKQHGNGSMGFLMPLYTAGILIFFLYTILKLAVKREDCDDEPHPNIDAHSARISTTPIYKDYQLDKEYRKFIFSEAYDDYGNPIQCRRHRIVTRDSKEDEIIILKKRLEATQTAMLTVLTHMRKVNRKLNTMKNEPTMTGDDQHRKNSRPEENDEMIDSVDKCEKVIRRALTDGDLKVNDDDEHDERSPDESEQDECLCECCRKKNIQEMTSTLNEERSSEVDVIEFENSDNSFEQTENTNDKHDVVNTEKEE